MSSFKRNVSRTTGLNAPCPPGFHPSHYNGAPITSTGIASLDDLLGGGLPVSCSFLIQEDHDGTYAKLILRYAMAQAIASNQHLIVVGSSFDDGGDPHKVIHRLMSLDESYETLEQSSSSPQNSTKSPDEPSGQHVPTGDSEDEDDEDDDLNAKNSTTQRMKIAWRYENLQKHHKEADTQYQQSRCHSFNLSKTMKLSPDQLSKIDCIDTKNLQNFSSDLLINTIRRRVEEKRNSSSSFRIVIQSIGSIGWPPIQDFMIFRFFKDLEVFLRDNIAAKVAIISFPSSYRSGELSKILPWATSGSMSLHSFAGEDRSQAAFPNHQGAVEFIRLPCPASLSSPATKLSTIRSLGGGMEGNLGFKLGRRKGFRIEMMGLGLDIDNDNDEDDAPENRREQPSFQFQDTSDQTIDPSADTKVQNKKTGLKPKFKVRFGDGDSSSKKSLSLKNTDW